MINENANDYDDWDCHDECVDQSCLKDYEVGGGVGDEYAGQPDPFVLQAQFRPGHLFGYLDWDLMNNTWKLL